MKNSLNAPHMSLYATKIHVGQERYYLLWPSTCEAAATEFICHYASIGLGENIDVDDPASIKLQVCYGLESDANWATAIHDAKRWEQDGCIDLAPIVKQVIQQIDTPWQTSLIDRAMGLSNALQEHLGQQPIKQAPTIAIAGLDVAETMLVRLASAAKCEDETEDVNSLVAAVREVIEAAAPILQRFE